MAEFIYNNTENTCTCHTQFKLNYRYHPHVSFKHNGNSCSRSCSAKELAKELMDLIFIYEQNLLHAQDI